MVQIIEVSKANLIAIWFAVKVTKITFLVSISSICTSGNFVSDVELAYMIDDIEAKMNIQSQSDTYNQEFNDSGTFEAALNMYLYLVTCPPINVLKGLQILKGLGSGNLLERDIYSHWYHGFSRITLPFWNPLNGFSQKIYSSAHSGIINTKDFNEDVNHQSLENILLTQYFKIVLYPPNIMVDDNDEGNNEKVKLSIEIRTKPIIPYNESKEEHYDYYNSEIMSESGLDEIFNVVDSQIKEIKTQEAQLLTRRSLTREDIVNNVKSIMPGFSLMYKWKPEHLFESTGMFENSTVTVEFRR